MLVSGSPPPQERGEDDGAAGRGGRGGGDARVGEAVADHLFFDCEINLKVRCLRFQSKKLYLASTVALASLPNTSTNRTAIVRFPAGSWGLLAVVMTVLTRFPLPLMACHMDLKVMPS